MLYIRADGNMEIGMGHVMRCLSIAEAAAEIDGQQPPAFITADEECRAMIEDRGFRVIVLNTDYRDMMSELPQLEELFYDTSQEAFPLSVKRDVLLVDSYQVSDAYYIALRKLVRVACLEDMGLAYPVDLLINYNIYAPGLWKNYQEPALEDCTENEYPQCVLAGTESANGIDGKLTKKCPGKVLLGTEYMPLRRMFQKPAGYVVKDKAANVIITTGGSDPYFAMGTITDALCSDTMIAEQGIHLHLISGPFNRFADELRRKYRSDDVQESGGHKTSQTDISKVIITIHENVKDMRSLFLESDVVITAAGSTIYEVCSLGVPMIVFYFAENQRQGAEALEKLTDIVNAGCFAEHAGTVADRVKENLKRCISDKSYRELLSRQEKSLIDGKGARRIAEQLTEMREDDGRRKKETIKL